MVVLYVVLGMTSLLMGILLECLMIVAARADEQSEELYERLAKMPKVPERQD
jgi:hypothetical protein